MTLPRLEDISQEELGIQDAILKYISSNFVSLNYHAVKYFNHHLNNVTSTIIEKMRSEDKLFNSIFQREHVAGSFWDKLKIGKPVEFDKNLVLYLPSVLYKNIKISPASPSYVLVNVKNGIEYLKKSKCDSFRAEWYDDEGNIKADKVRQWMEGVMSKAFERQLFKRSHNKYLLECGEANYQVGIRKSGPAITVEVEVLRDARYFHIDLVPSFEFQVKDWPKHIRSCPANAQNKPWHLVPKPLKPGENSCNISERLQWRLSFHDQESYIIHNLYHFKAVLKLLKKLRDLKFDQYTMSSYALKTVFMLELDNQDDLFWRQRLSLTFLHMLNVLTKRYEDGKIPFYWDPNHNLLGKLSDDQIMQVFRTLKKLYTKIMDGLQKGEHFIVASSLLNEKEFDKLKSEPEFRRL